MAIIERGGPRPVLREPPTGEVLFDEKSPPRSLREAVDRWTHVFGNKPVQLDPATLRPLVFSEFISSSQDSTQYLRFLINLANDGDPVRTLFLLPRPLEGSREDLIQFAFAWDRSGHTRRFDLTFHDEDSSLYSFTIGDVNKPPDQIDSSSPFDFPAERVSGLRGFLQAGNPSVQRQIVSDLAALIYPRAK